MVTKHDNNMSTLSSHDAGYTSQVSGAALQKKKSQFMHTDNNFKGSDNIPISARRLSNTSMDQQEMTNSGLRERYNTVKGVHLTDEKRKSTQEYAYDPRLQNSASKTAAHAEQMIRSDIQWLVGKNDEPETSHIND